MIDSKGRVFGCSGLAKAVEAAWKRKSGSKLPLPDEVLYKVNYMRGQRNVKENFAQSFVNQNLWSGGLQACGFGALARGICVLSQLRIGVGQELVGFGGSRLDAGGFL